MRSLLPLVSVLLAAGAAPAALAAGCGDSVIVQPDDTLSRIAARCDVSEASLLRANPSIEGSSDLQVGERLQIADGGSQAQKVGSAVGQFTRRASHAIGDLAGDVGSSVQDLLDKNPDLKGRLDKLGKDVGLAGQDEAASVSVSPKSGPAGSTVTISGSGLPKNAPVAIGAGAPGAAYEVIGHAQSTADGAIAATVKTPAAAQPGQELAFSLATSSGVVARSQRFLVSR
jgi:LysM repeat protein